MQPLVTPDGRYIVVRGRLWRRSNPALNPGDRELLTRQLMDARRAKKEALKADDHHARESAMRAVQASKVGLGERGPVWWTDGAPDYTRYLAKNTPYCDWFKTVTAASSASDDA